MELNELQDIVGMPAQGFNVTDEIFLNTLLTDSKIIEIGSITLNEVKVYAIIVGDDLFTIKKDLFHFLIYTL
jgi:hypothetical protein